LKDFKDKAVKIGIRQFVIQTHIESAMDVTNETVVAVKKILQAGWIVTNQMVFTTAGSRRGHTAKLRQVLNKIGVLPYYTFTVKGYLENSYNFTPNARSVQEQLEEKVVGQIPTAFYPQIKALPEAPEKIADMITRLKGWIYAPFLATDRNVLNLPGVGKSMTFRVVGITRYGKRILEFDPDPTRNHSPVIQKMGKVYIVESKSISQYLKQLEEMGEDLSEYQSIWGYSLGESEPTMPLYRYPEYEYTTTTRLTNYELPDKYRE